MPQARQMYLMISGTDTRIGKLIRTVFQYPYNHVSLTLEPDLKVWYSFARYIQDAPFYGGFVREPAERFLAAKGQVPVKIFQINIPEAHALRLERYISGAGCPGHRLLYNYYEALSCCIGLHVPIPNAHTCISFANTVLDRQFRSIEELSTELQPYLYFEGNLSQLVSDSGERDDRYFSHAGLIRGTVNAAVQFSLLSCRLVRHGFDSYMAHRFHRSVH